MSSIIVVIIVKIIFLVDDFSFNVLYRVIAFKQTQTVYTNFSKLFYCISTTLRSCFAILIDKTGMGWFTSGVQTTQGYRQSNFKST